MTNIANFAREFDEGQEGAFLALTLFNDLLSLLREKGVLSADDVTGLLESAAHSLSKSPNALAKRGARFVSDTILPEHKLG